MYRQRAQSQRIHSKHHDKRHCPEDLTCKEFCKCVEILKKQNKILSEKNQSWLKEKEDLVKAIMKLNKEIKSWEKREKQFLDMDLFKRKLREQVRAEVQQKNKIDNLILKQKYENIKKEREQLERKRDHLTMQLENISKELKSYEQKLKQSNQQLLRQQQENQKNKLVKEQQLNTINELKGKLVSLQQIIKDKTNIITRLQQSLSVAEKNYLLEKSKCSENQFEAVKLQQEVKRTSQIIQDLKKEASKHNNSIQVLTKDNNKLGHLVKQLQSTISSYNVLEGELRHRIHVTEDYALQKEIQAKHLEADYYNSLYQRSI